MRTKGLLSIIMLLGLLFTVQAADHVKGNGTLTTKKIKIDDYNAIKIDGVIDFNYEQSNAEPYIEITVDENLHEYVNINIKDRELSVGFKGAKSGSLYQIHRKDQLQMAERGKSRRKCEFHDK